ncbi:MAG: CusA/CzcA family heavy metal efflux RND transporter [Elusimicrobia bacterium CG22_combo_CG10-13_8_21_14_all_63_91]|nr:MAG: CusA/CzcA family heavy metal efflux RND transporter [Elusimicrobia bacterium CG22_combo_CG10-13_8_21_14_all_63_91]PJA18003.1 MAG: CusA/CzcA family heavy metal efflux RND transporter [Elusimicrobia bacterium CG_4_10_14_0_2_um_filter_63_34]
MIPRLIAWCVKNRFFVFLGTGFGILWGVFALRSIPLDAIPDLSDVQVIVFTEWQGRSPDLVEDQVTYPIVTSMVAAPKVKTARGYSFFGLSFVYVIFEDGTDIYWARSRILEYLSKIRGKLPDGVNPTLGPDATGVGWVFEYALVDKTGQNDLADLRSFQDWYLRYYLESVPGVAEVASVGGFVKQYQVEVDPDALLAYGIPLSKVNEAIRRSNNDVGGRVLEMAEREYIVRGRGYIKSLSDIEEIPVGLGEGGVPVLVKNVARVRFGPEMRRGAAELDGEGEVVGGVVVMRFGENALSVIDRVKKKLTAVKSALPPGVEVVVVYDRSDLIKRSISTLTHKLGEEMLVVAVVIFVFLWHFRSALLPILTLPVAVLLSFIPMYYLGVSSNIMSLGGIAIAVGAMVDASVVMVENAHKRLEEWEEGGRKEDVSAVLLRATQEVGRPIFFSLIVIAVSFMPIFTLEAQEGRLFKPLAFTKNFSMFFAAALAVTLVPVLMQILLKPARKLNWRGPFGRAANFLWAGEIHAEEKHPISRWLFAVYEPVLRWILDRRKTVIAAAAAIVLSAVPVYMQLGSEFMPKLNEGDILYMPTTLPGISIETAKGWLQIQDKLIRRFGEVERVFGKIGRARSATDPAPLSMVETLVKLKPHDEWPEIEKEKSFLGFKWKAKGRRSWEELIDALDAEMRLPGTTNAWTMPIKTRIDMLTTGIRTPIGIKVFGPDRGEIERIGTEIEGLIPAVAGTRSAFAERVTGGYFLDFEVRREEAARYGLTVGAVEDVIESAIGGKNVTTTVEGRERYPVNVRYGRDLRDDLDRLKRVLVPTPTGAQIPIMQVADLWIKTGAPAIKDENGMLTGWVYVDLQTDRDIGSYVEEAKAHLAANLKIPAGYYLEWSGQFEFMERAKRKMMLVLPVTLLVIVVLLFINTGSWVKTGIVLLAVPFSVVGAVWLLWLLDYNMSVAVWVGLIALAGVDAETGVVMLLYLDIAYANAVREKKMRALAQLEEAVMHGAVKRIRPKMMTVGTTFIGLLPIMWAATYESGADVMKRIAAPMVGGILTSFIMELLVYPAIYTVWKWRFEMREGKTSDEELLARVEAETLEMEA